MYTLKNRERAVKMGITATKKVGNAVARNRARRLIRAAWRTLLLKEDLNCATGYDIVLVARTRILSETSIQVEKQLKWHLKKAGVINR